MPQPTYRDLYVNRPLTNLSIAYQQQQRNYVADSIFPQVPVNRQGDLYYIYNMDDWFRTQAGVRAPATESPGTGWNITTGQYYANVYSFHHDIDDQTRANADVVFDLDRDSTLFVTQNLLLKRDQLFASTFLQTGIWTGGSGGVDQVGVAATPGANQFLRFDVAGSDPTGVITAQRLQIQRQTGFLPNTLVMGPTVLQVLQNHAAILDRIKYTERGIVTTDLLQALFGVDRVIVTNAIQNTAPKGAAAPAMSFLSDKSMLLCYSAPAPGLMTPSAGYIFTWTGLLGAGAYGTRIKRFRMEQIESDRVEGEMAFAMQVVAPQLGVFFSQAVS